MQRYKSDEAHWNNGSDTLCKSDSGKYCLYSEAMQEIEKKDMDIERLDALAFERLQIIAEQAQQITTLEEKLVATETSASKEIVELKATINRKNTQIEAYRKGPLIDNDQREKAKLTRLTTDKVTGYPINPVRSHRLTK